MKTHANLSFDGIETNEPDAVRQERLHLRSDLNKLATKSCTAENHEQVNTN